MDLEVMGIYERGLMVESVVTEKQFKAGLMPSVDRQVSSNHEAESSHYDSTPGYGCISQLQERIYYSRCNVIFS
jgi:hypothetical protein